MYRKKIFKYYIFLLILQLVWKLYILLTWLRYFYATNIPKRLLFSFINNIKEVLYLRHKASLIIPSIFARNTYRSEPLLWNNKRHFFVIPWIFSELFELYVMNYLSCVYILFIYAYMDRSNNHKLIIQCFFNFFHSLKLFNKFPIIFELFVFCHFLLFFYFFLIS